MWGGKRNHFNLYVQDRHPVVMKIQSKWWRLSVRTKLVSCDWQPSPFALYIACWAALFMQHVCVCVLFICVNLCCWSGIAPTCWICTTLFLFYLVGIYLSCDFKLYSAQLDLCLLFILSAVCSVCLLQNFLLRSSVIYFPQVSHFSVISLLAWNWNRVFVLGLTLFVIVLVTLCDIS